MKSKFQLSVLGFACLLCVANGQQPSIADTVGPSQNPASPTSDMVLPTTLISLELTNATLADVIGALGHKYRVPIVCDCFVNDVKLGPIKYDKVPLADVIHSLADRYQRDSQYTNGIFVLRSRDLPIRSAQEKTAIQQNGFKWPDSGLVESKRWDEGDALSPAIQFRAQASSKSAPKLPARFIYLEAQNAPAFKVVQALSSSSEWLVDLDIALVQRRMSAYLYHVTPGQAAEAITYLLNAGQHVSIKQTDAQKLNDAEMSDSRDIRVKLSEVLAAKLAPLLTDAQRGQLAKGMDVTLPLSAFSSDLQDLAKSYAELSFGSRTRGLTLDLSRWKSFEIVIVPGMPALGVNGFSTDGQNVGW